MSWYGRLEFCVCILMVISSFRGNYGYNYNYIQPKLEILSEPRPRIKIHVIVKTARILNYETV